MSLLQQFQDLLLTGVEFGALNALSVLGLMIALRFGGFPDLTIEGTIPLSAAAAALAVTAGMSPFESLCIAVLVGATAGTLTAILHLFTGMSRLMASILMMTALYAVSLRALKGSNLPLFQYLTWFPNDASWIGRFSWTAIIVIPLFVGVILFLYTEFGLLLRATGENWSLVRKLGKPCWLYLVCTLALSNAFIGLSAGLLTHYNRFADVGFGSGSIVTCLAALLLGEAIVLPTSVERQMLAVAVGSIIYYTAVALALRLGLNPWDLKLASGGFVLLAILLSRTYSAENKGLRIGCDPL